MPPAKGIPIESIVAAFEEAGTVRGAARRLGIHNTVVSRRLRLHGVQPQPVSGTAKRKVGKPRENGASADAPPVTHGRVQSLQEREEPLPKRGVKRYLLTCAQNNTPVHAALWENILALAGHYRAEIMVSRFTYDKASYKNGVMEKLGAGRLSDYEDVYYAAEVAPYLADERVQIAPGLTWCGEMNILPTAVRPLSGFESYTGRNSGIFPHVKVAMESIASGKHEPAKINYTTGTVTMRNYIQRKAGLKAEFHHCLHPDTEFLTDKGLRTLRECAGSTVRVWSGEAWETALIRSFGEQALNEVVLAPAVRQNCNGTMTFRAQNSKIEHRVWATATHAWHLADGGVTHALAEGDVIPAAAVPPEDSGPDFEEGVRHGLIFGDGSVIYQSVKTGEFSHQVCLHGDAAGKWRRLFSNVTRWPSREHIENYEGTAYWRSPHNMKELPDRDATPAYIRGFFVGWIAADGHLNKRDDCTQLCSVTKYALEWAVRMAPYAGLVATGFCKGSGDFTTFGELREPCWRLTLSDAPRYWKVKYINERPGRQEVMCAVVEPSHKFTLAGGILTGNCYGALLVEVCPDGSWFVRQINADGVGTIHDLDVRVRRGKLTTGNRVEAINWGDVHALRLSKIIKDLCWGEGGMLDTLRPKFQFMNDTFDFHSRNHHDRYNPHKMYEKHLSGDEDVRLELNKTGHFLCEASRPWCKTEVVESNHDNGLQRWLANDPAWYAKDPINARVFLELQIAKYDAIQKGSRRPLLEEAIRLSGVRLPASVHFLEEDESFIICGDSQGGIDCGMHGHNGPNGARGTRNALAKMGRKSNIGHSHSTGITDGCYQAGLKPDPNLGYNVGPSSWSDSDIITYPNGKRAIVTWCKGKWRAQ